MDADTGQILYDKGMHQRVYPASTTKILTALLVVETALPHEIMTVSASALYGLPSYGSHIALVEGEFISVEDALYAIMLPSANDASNVLAEHVAGSLDAFALMLTERAHQIGAVNSNFTNAHGLHCENHFSTAYDMALITRHAMENEDFRRYFGAARHVMPPTNKNVERNFHNHQYMLVPEIGYFRPDVTGGKVGFTHPARNTMSTTASRDGRNLICVVMYSNARTEKFRDTAALLDFGFDEFVPFTVSRENFSGLEVPVTREGIIKGVAVFDSAHDFTALLHTSADPYQLRILQNNPGFYDYDNPAAFFASFELPSALPFVPSLLGTVELDPFLDIPIPAAFLSLDGAEASAPFWQRALRTAGIALGGLLILFALFVAYRRIQIAKRRRKRMERMERAERKRMEAELAAAARRPPNVTRRPRSDFYLTNNGYERRTVR